MDFTNREIASYIWFAGLVVFFLVREPSIHRPLAELARIFVKPKLIALFGSATIYILLWISFFASIGLWTYGNLKTTILWAATFAFVSFFELTRIQAAKEEKAFFTRLVRKAFAVTGVLTFIVELHSFSLVVELIVFPVLFIATILHSIAGREPKSKTAQKLLSAILMAAGTWLFLYSLYMTLVDIPKVASLDTFREFGVTILLSLTFLPFLYGFLLLLTYEKAFFSLQWQIPDETLRKRAKWEALVRFGPRLNLLRKWAANVAGSPPTTVGELRRSLNEALTAARHEASPPFIKPSEGWSPYRAKTFLDRHALATREYHRSFDGEWFAGSPYLELGGGSALANNLAYYVTGTERIATSLKLRLNINQPEERELAEARFIEVGRTLLEASLGLPGAEPAIRMLSIAKPQEIRINTRVIRLTHEPWAGGIPGGYSRLLDIKIEQVL